MQIVSKTTGKRGTKQMQNVTASGQGLRTLYSRLKSNSCMSKVNLLRRHSFGSILIGKAVTIHSISGGTAGRFPTRSPIFQPIRILTYKIISRTKPVVHRERIALRLILIP